MRFTGITVGPLQLLKVNGSELKEGDVVQTEDRLVVIIRSYSLEHIRKQNTDVDDGRKDEHGDYVSPYHRQFNMDEEYFVLRAKG